MKALTSSILLLAASAAGCFAQQWEFGGNAGGSLLTSVTATAPAGSATAGFKQGIAFGAYLGQNMYKHLSGEIHYGFIKNDLRLKGLGQEATFGGQSHVLHYDSVLHTGGKTAQVFAAFGGGLKVFRGTGKEAAYQPLSQFAYLTKTQELKPMGDAGVGVKFFIGSKVVFRAEVRDYITAFPKKVITPATGAKFGGSLLHDLVPTIGIGYLF
jgi:hypothetical protein